MSSKKRKGHLITHDFGEEVYLEETRRPTRSKKKARPQRIDSLMTVVPEISGHNINLEDTLGGMHMFNDDPPPVAHPIGKLPVRSKVSQEKYLST